jgi:hypothetical protein
MTIPKYVSSFAVGFLFGAGLALLITPLPGKKMQKKVIDKVDDLKVAARRMAS